MGGARGGENAGDGDLVLVVHRVSGIDSAHRTKAETRGDAQAGCRFGPSHCLVACVGQSALGEGEAGVRFPGELCQKARLDGVDPHPGVGMAGDQGEPIGHRRVLFYRRKQGPGHRSRHVLQVVQGIENDLQG